MQSIVHALIFNFDMGWFQVGSAYRCLPSINVSSSSCVEEVWKSHSFHLFRRVDCIRCQVLVSLAYIYNADFK